MEIPENQIFPNPEQPRQQFSPDELEGLASSIRQHGVINAIAVERVTDGVYILIDGERRLRAARMAGLKTIPAEVRPMAVGGGTTDRLILAMVANLQRADMNPIEEARGVKRLADQGLSNTAIAHKLGKYPTWVSNRLNLLELSDEIQDLIAAGELPADVVAVNALRKIRNPELRLKTARRIARPGQTIKVVEAVCTKVARAEQAANQGQGAPMAEPVLSVARQQFETRATRPVRYQQLEGKWNLLADAGDLPAWKLFRRLAMETCQGCQLHDVASAKVCVECPGVDLVRRLMQAVHDAE